MTIRGCIENVQMSALILASILAIAAPLPAVAEEVHAFDVSAQDPASAIRAFGAQAEIQILASADDLKGKKFNPVSGDISTEDALNHLLAGTGLAHPYVGDRAVALVSNSAAAAQPSTSSTQIVAGSVKPPSDRILLAQANTTGAQSQSGLEEIIVTATRRESTVQNTPISMTAVSGQDIQDRGLADLRTLAQSVPGVSMRTSGPGQTEFEMRGMASVGGNSPTVGFYLDDTPLTAPAATNEGKVVIDPNLYDLNRIEVLRGPQGTVYGSGSMGGTIKIIPNAPNPAAFDASAEAIVGGTDGGGFNHGENAMVNLPFAGGTAALRIVGSESHESGWIDRIVIANGAFPLPTNNSTVRGNVLAAPVAADYKNANDTDLQAVRASLLWQPTDRLAITPSFFYQRIDQDNLSQIDSVPGTDAHYQPFDVPEPVSDNFDLDSVNVRYKFDAFDLTSTTSYWNRSEHIAQDAAEQWQWGLGLPSFYTSQGGLGLIAPNLENATSKQTSEELRLTSSGNSAFKWLFGYFYSDFESNWKVYILAPGAVPAFGTSNLYTQTQPTKIIQQSAFGEVSYELTSQLKATAGLRRYSYNTSVNTSVSGAASASGSDAVVDYSSTESKQGVNPKFDLSYDVSKNMMLYATVAKGFRPGGADTPVPTSGTVGAGCEANLQAIHGTTAFVPSPVTYLPDQVWNYELGEKLRAFDDRLTVNSAVYFENWTGIQQAIPLPCGYGYTGNAGDAHIYGSEVEVQAVLVPGLILSANVGYTHARIASSDVGAILPTGVPIQEVPDWTSSQSIAYRHGISNQFAFTARVENDYVGARTDATYAINQLPSYDLTQIRVGVESDQWSAVLFANNVLNKQTILNNVQQISINLPTYNRATVSQPLTVGIDINYHFGR